MEGENDSTRKENQKEEQEITIKQDERDHELSEKEEKCIQIAVNYVRHSVIGNTPGGYLFSPYSFKFSVFKYPLLFASGGKTTSINHNVIKQPVEKTFSTTSDNSHLKLLFVGDVMITNKEAPISASQNIQDIFGGASVVIANIESPVGHKERVANSAVKHKLAFDMSLDFLSESFKNLNILPEKCLLNIANNHSGDIGEDGIDKTIKHLSSVGSHVIGTSLSDRGIVCKFTLNGCTIGVVSWSRWMNYNSKRNHLPIYREEDVVNYDWESFKVKENIDVLIGFPHWDYEQSYSPSEETRERAKFFCSSKKFDVICGHGPHVIQPIEIHGENCVCAYSVGNLCSERGAWHTKLGGIFEINIIDKKVAGYKMHTFLQQKNTGNIYIDLVRKDKVDHRIAHRLSQLFA